MSFVNISLVYSAEKKTKQLKSIIKISRAKNVPVKTYCWPVAVVLQSPENNALN